jgi:hypothetical protein
MAGPSRRGRLRCLDSTKPRSEQDHSRGIEGLSDEEVDAPMSYLILRIPTDFRKPPSGHIVPR